MSAPILSVIVPAHDEEASIETVVRDVARHVVKLVDDGGTGGAVEMVVVDDASSDGTAAVLDRLAAELPWLRVVRLERNVGHGPAVATGLRLAAGQLVFQLDADCQFLVEDFQLLWEHSDSGALVLGVRAVRRDALHRLLLSKAAAGFAGVLAGRRLRDANTPFRLFRRHLWSDVTAVVGDAPSIPSVATCVTAARRGVPIVEVEVTHLPRSHGRSTLNLRRMAPLVVRGAVELGAATVRLSRPAARFESS